MTKTLSSYPPPSGPPVIPVPYKKRSRTIAVVLIAVISALLLCCVGFYFLVIQRPSSPREIPITAYWAPGVDNTFFNSENTGEYYPSIKEALEHSSYDEQSSVIRTSKEVFRFEDENSATVYCFGRNGAGDELLAGYLFDMKDGQYSRLLFIRVAMLDLDKSSSSFLQNLVYQEDELAAYYINITTFVPEEYARSNNGQPTYLGITQDENIKNLRILGKAPTKIITVAHEDKTYYIWYYIGTDFRQVLLDDPNFTFTEYTYGQIIEILDIYFEGE
jgi:hypothetical protein